MKVLLKILRCKSNVKFLHLPDNSWARAWFRIGLCSPQGQGWDRILRCWGVGGKARRQEQKRRAYAPTNEAPGLVSCSSYTSVCTFSGSLGSICPHFWPWSCPSSAYLWPSSSSPGTWLRTHIFKAGLLILNPPFWFLHSTPLWNYCSLLLFLIPDSFSSSLLWTGVKGKS